MPLFEYRCTKCGRTFESYRKPSDEAGTDKCPTCGGVAEKLGISLFSAKGSDCGSSCGGGVGGGWRPPFG